MRHLAVMLTLGLAAGLGARALAAHHPPRSTGATLSASLERITGLAELRLLRTELSSFQCATSPSGFGGVKAVVPVTVVLGIDLRLVKVIPAGDDVVVVVPMARVLDHSTDHGRWLIWEELGGNLEGAELERLLTAQAIHSAQEDIQRLGLMAIAQREAESAVKELAVAIGFAGGHVRVVSRSAAPTL